MLRTTFLSLRLLGISVWWVRRQDICCQLNILNTNDLVLPLHYGSWYVSFQQHKPSLLILILPKQTTSHWASRVTHLLLSCKSFSSLGLGSFGRPRRCSLRNAVDVEWILRWRSSWRGPRELSAVASPSSGWGQPRVRIRWAIDITPSPFFRILTLNSSTSGKEYVVSPHLKNSIMTFKKNYNDSYWKWKCIMMTLVYNIIVTSVAPNSTHVHQNYIPEMGNFQPQLLENHNGLWKINIFRGRFRRPNAVRW